MKRCHEVQQLLSQLPLSEVLQSSSWVESHLEFCPDCQGIYPTQSSLKELFQVWPDLEPDLRLLQTVRGNIYREMDRLQDGNSSIRFLPSLLFATGIAALLALLAVPNNWVSLSEPIPQGQNSRFRTQAGLLNSPLSPAFRADTVNLSGSPSVLPSSILHVIEWNQSQAKRKASSAGQPLVQEALGKQMRPQVQQAIAVEGTQEVRQRVASSDL